MNRREAAEDALLDAITKAAKKGESTSCVEFADALAAVRGDNKDGTSQSAVGFVMTASPDDPWEQAQL